MPQHTKDGVNFAACLNTVNALRHSSDRVLSRLGTVASDYVHDGKYEGALIYLLGAQEALQADGEYGTERIAALKQCRLQLKAAIPGRL